MELWRLILLIVVRLVLSAGILWAVYKYLGMIPFILGIPVAGVLMAKPIIEVAANWFNWANKQPFEKWHGRYYSFADKQIRMLEVGEELWAVDADLLRVIGEKPTLMLGSTYGSEDYGPIPDTKLHGFSPSGAEKALRKSSHHEASRMLMWLQREVYKVHQRKQDIARENLSRPLP